jgi:Uma2 family endonuclease
MQDAPFRPATYDDLIAVPPNMVAEIIDGRLVTMPRPRPRALRAASILGTLLTGPFDLGINGPGGWWVLDEPELHLADDVAVPDLAGWRRERLTAIPDTAWFDLTPDWVCEVLSPKTQRYDKGEKRDLYARHGVGYLWHVDPDARLLEVFSLNDGKWLVEHTFRDDDAVAAPPFGAIPFRLGLLWGG